MSSRFSSIAVLTTEIRSGVFWNDRMDPRGGFSLLRLTPTISRGYSARWRHFLSMGRLRPTIRQWDLPMVLYCFVPLETKLPMSLRFQVIFVWTVLHWTKRLTVGTQPT